MTVYTVDEPRDIAVPIAKGFGMRSVAVFGPYACGESDIDLVMDHGDQRITRLFGVGGEVEAVMP